LLHQGNRFKTLDGQNRNLHRTKSLITTETDVALAGVMGGGSSRRHTKFSFGSSDFDQATIRRSARSACAAGIDPLRTGVNQALMTACNRAVR